MYRVLKSWIALFIVCIVIVCFALLPTAMADDWFQYHGSNRDRISTETGWDTDWSDAAPKIAWKASVGTGFSSFSVVDGRVYTMGNTDDQDTVWCFDAITGDMIWKHTYHCELHPMLYEGGPGCTPTVYDGLVYTFSKEGQFYCLDAKTGEEKWLIDLQKEHGAKLSEWRFAVSPLIEKNWVVLEIGFFAAFDRKTGDLVWKGDKSYQAGYGSPIAFDWNGKRCFAGFNGYGLFIVDASNGNEISNFEWKTRSGINAATPIRKDNQFFISSGYGVGGGLISVDESGKAEQKWHNRLMRNQINTCVLWEDHLYGFDESNLRCLSFTSGEETWSKSGLGKASLMIADGKLLILSEKGDLVLAEINPNEYKEISRVNVLSGKCWTIPVLANGLIYCRNAKGDVVCVDVRK